MIDIDVSGKTFGKQQILGSCKLSLEAGARVSLLGPSGIGKSTLLRIIAGLDTRYDGKVNRPKKIAYMFQGPNLLEWRNCYQNLMIFHPDATQSDAEEALKQVGLGDKGMHFPGSSHWANNADSHWPEPFLARPTLCYWMSHSPHSTHS